MRTAFFACLLSLTSAAALAQSHTIVALSHTGLSGTVHITANTRAAGTTPAHSMMRHAQSRSALTTG